MHVQTIRPPGDGIHWRDATFQVTEALVVRADDGSSGTERSSLVQ